MASWLVREKRAPMVIVELLEEATRDLVWGEVRRASSVEQAAPRQKTADPPSPRLRRASWRPPLLGVRQARAMLRQVLFALQALRSDRLARAFFAPGRQL